MICIISVTAKGDILGKKIKNHFGGELYCKSKIADFKLDSITKECFEKYDSIIFISSTGIAVRAIAKYLERKDKDPAVVVVDVCNKFSISLVSGHLGGANNLTISVAKLLNNTPVITTATDNMDILAPDVIAMNNNLVIDDLKLAKVIASRLVNNEEVHFKDDKNLVNCPKRYTQVDNLRKYTLWITNKHKPIYKLKGEESFKVSCNNSILKLIRRDIVLGIGCRRNTDKDKMYEFVKVSLEENNLDLRAIALISSIDIKQDENAILSLKEKLNCDIKFFTKEEIASIEDKYEGSEFVKKTVGVSCVSEPVVELCGGNIIVKKIKKDGITLAIGELN
ncbi:cobalt-precorrin 5A hydrolase [Clostridioides difficile]